MFIRLVKGHSYAVRATRQDGLPRQLHYGPASEEEMRPSNGPGSKHDVLASEAGACMTKSRQSIVN